MSANIKDIQTKVATLKSMFPEWSEDELKEALVQYKGIVEDVVDKILCGIITPWEKLEKNSNNNKQSNQANTSHIVGATRPGANTNSTSTNATSNFRNSTFKNIKTPNNNKFNSHHVGTKPAQTSRITGSNASLKKPAASLTNTATKISASKKNESAIELLEAYKGFAVLSAEEVDDLTWADKMTYKKKLKEYTSLQEQAKEELEKKKAEEELKEKEAKAAPVEETPAEPVAKEVPAANDDEEEKQAEKEEAEEETEEQEPTAEAPESEEASPEVEQAAEIEQEESTEEEKAPAAAKAESAPKQTNMLEDYGNMKSAVDDMSSQQQMGTPSSQFQQASQQQFMGFNGAPNYPQYNQGFMPQNQMYPNNFADQMAMYNQFAAYNYFQQMQHMQQQAQQQQQGSGANTAPNTASGESPSQQPYDFASGRQMMGMQYPQFMQSSYGGYPYGQFSGQQPIPGQEEQQQQQSSEMPQSQDQYAYYQQQQMQQPYGQQNYYNMNQNYNQY